MDPQKSVPGGVVGGVGGRYEAQLFDPTTMQSFTCRYELLDKINEGGYGEIYTCVTSLEYFSFLSVAMEPSEIQSGPNFLPPIFSYVEPRFCARKYSSHSSLKHEISKRSGNISDDHLGDGGFLRGLSIIFPSHRLNFNPSKYLMLIFLMYSEYV